MNEWADNIFNLKMHLLFAALVLVCFTIIFSVAGVFPLSSVDMLAVVITTLLVALFRPGWMFMFFIALLPLENIVLGKIGLAVRPYQLAGAAIFLTLLIRALRKKLPVEFPKLAWTDIWIGGIALGSVLGLTATSDLSATTRLIAVLASFVVIYWLGRYYIQTQSDLRKIISFTLLGGLLVLGYAIIQNWRFIHGFNSWEVMPGRPNSTFAEPDWFGMYAVFFVAVIFSVIYNLKNAAQELKLVAAYFMLFFTIIALILSVSRSAWLGAGLVAVAFLKIILTDAKINPKYWQWKPFLKELVLIIALVLISLGTIKIFDLTNFQLAARAQSASNGLQKITIACQGGLDETAPVNIRSIEELAQYHCWHINLEDIKKEEAAGNRVMEVYRPDPNVGIRGKIYSLAWSEIKKHPLTGIGWGSIGKILGTDERGAGLNASNIFLETWLGSGILGLLSLVGIFGWVIFQSARKLMNTQDLNTRAILVFVLLGAVAIVVPNLFNAGIFLGFIWIYLAIAVSILSEKHGKKETLWRSATEG